MASSPDVEDLPFSRHLGADGNTSTNMIELRQKRAVMSIFVVHSDDGASSKAVEKALEAVIFEECKKRSDSIHLLLLYVTGGAAATSSSSRRSRRSCLNCCRLYEFVNAVGRFPWPVIGFADGCVSSLGSSLLEAADHVLASPLAQFKLSHADSLISVTEAVHAGRVHEVLESSETLMATHRDYCKKGAPASGPVADLLRQARAHGRPHRGPLLCACQRSAAAAAAAAGTATPSAATAAATAAVTAATAATAALNASVTATASGTETGMSADASTAAASATTTAGAAASTDSTANAASPVAASLQGLAEVSGAAPEAAAPTPAPPPPDVPPVPVRLPGAQALGNRLLGPEPQRSAAAPVAVAPAAAAPPAPPGAHSAAPAAPAPLAAAAAASALAPAAAAAARTTATVLSADPVQAGPRSAAGGLADLGLGHALASEPGGGSWPRTAAAAPDSAASALHQATGGYDLAHAPQTVDACPSATATSAGATSAGAAVPNTTVVIYDFPAGITSGELAATIALLGFGERYNLLYIEDVRSGGQPRGSFGLVNFLTRHDTEAFADAFYNYSTSGATSRTASGKLQVSNVQGLRSIIESWIRSSSTGPMQLFF